MTTEPIDQLYANLPHGKLGQLCELTRIIGSSLDQTKVQDGIIVGSMVLTESEYGSISLIAADGRLSVNLDRWEGSFTEETARMCDQVVAPWVIANRKVYRTDNLAEDTRISDVDLALCSFGVLAAPIVYKGELVGVLILGRPAGDPFSNEDEMLLLIIAELASSVIHNIRHVSLITEENRRLRTQLQSQGSWRGLVGQSPAWHHVCTVIKNIGKSEARVLLLGESGTGKELCARALHEQSDRREKSFVAVNCAAMPESLAESELFGYTKGSFTGAAQDRHGLFAEADGGTLFLDEIGTASLQVQSSLLRAIQEGEIRPVGATVPQKVNVRLICATSADLNESVQKGSFRKDLFFRINVVTLSLPPLRDRREDIPLLASAFLQRATAKTGRTIQAVSPQALAALQSYHWPGNVRELENAIEHAVLFTSLEVNTVPVTALPSAILTAVGAIDGPEPRISDIGLDDMLGHYERHILLSTLERCGWNQSEAARVLGVSEKRIRTRMKAFALRGEGTSPA